jgi:hypothetical protein
MKRITNPSPSAQLWEATLVIKYSDRKEVIRTGPAPPLSIYTTSTTSP